MAGTRERKRLLKKFAQFCRGLTRNDRVAIIHHSDADGLSSALVAGKAIEMLSGKRPVAVQHYSYRDKGLLKKAASAMKKKKANVLVVVDLSIDGEPKPITETLRFEKCLVLDHHRMQRNLNSEKVLFIKSEFFSKQPSSYVTGKLAFDLFGKLADMKKLAWIACIGILGDHSLEKWRSFVKRTLKRQRISLGRLQELFEIVAATEVLAPGRLKSLFWLFFEAGSPDSVLKSPFRKLLKRFRRERDLLIRDFEENAEFFPDIGLFFHEMKSGHENLKSYVANAVSDMHPDKTVILLQNVGKRTRFSARRQDGKVKVNELLRQAVKGIPGGGAGGHAPAAAGSVPRKHAGKFRENVVRILGKKRAK